MDSRPHVCCHYRSHCCHHFHRRHGDRDKVSSIPNPSATRNYSTLDWPSVLLWTCQTHWPRVHTRERGRARHHPALYTSLENRWICRAVRTQGSGRGRREGGRGRHGASCVCPADQKAASCLWRSFEGCRQWQGREAGRPLRLSRFPQQDSGALRLAVLRVSVTLGFMVHQATPMEVGLNVCDMLGST
jgi:hypothetical protein